MQIAIIGTGNVGAALGQRWAAAGHDILFGVQQPVAAKVAAVVKKAGARARGLAVREAAAGAAVVALAVPFEALEQVIAECGNLTGKIVIDCNNPLLPTLSGLKVEHTALDQHGLWVWAGPKFPVSRAASISFTSCDRTSACRQRT
jgi:8-hydroxy-5-deazaflavin:NADPH oxidoreductase